jgi:hypothetical protein
MGEARSARGIGPLPVRISVRNAVEPYSILAV